MIRLDTTTRKLQALLGGAVTTNQMQCVSAYSDATQSGYVGATTVINTNNSTAVDIVPAPSAGYRDVDYINIYNRDTVSQTLTIRYNDNGTTYGLIVVTLLTGEQLNYTHGSGWCALDVNGNRKEVTSSTFSSITVAGVNITPARSQWTPVLASSGGGSASYTTQQGEYFYTAGMVVAQFYINGTKNTLGAGNLSITGLPYASKSGVYVYMPLGNFYVPAGTSIIQVNQYLNAASSTIALYKITAATTDSTGSNLTAGDISSTFSFGGVLTYYAS